MAIDEIGDDISLIGTASLQLLRVFLALVAILSAWNGLRLFMEARQRSHRLAGLVHLSCLVFGAAAVVRPSNELGRYLYSSDGDGRPALSGWAFRCLIYDVALSCLGILATLTAARDFPHRKVRNQPGQSGTLSVHATVTQGEMMEHAFYQFLNLCQALYLHWLTWASRWSIGSSILFEYNITCQSRTDPYSGDDCDLSSAKHYWDRWPLSRAPVGRLLAVLFATLPWSFRKRFPVHSFSANWIREGKQERPSGSQVTVTTSATEWIEARMYQIKKWQYVFYKLVILHGLNLSVAFPAVVASGLSEASGPLPLRQIWRIFWLCLNASYVMEFYLQSLVKRSFLTQAQMLGLQRLLMGASSLSALLAVKDVIRPELCVLSLLLNFTNRGWDLTNVMIVAVLASMVGGDLETGT